MSSRTILKWPCLAAALFAAGMVCLATPARGGLLPSRSGTGGILARAELEREMVTDALVAAGWSRDEAAGRVAVLTDGEVRRLADAGLAAGGAGAESGRTFRVGLVIVVVLAFITGVYLFAEAD